MCRSDCHSTRGYCDVPGDCKCRLGWAGKSCKECQVLPGCLHGYCDKPLECKCYPGYTGILYQTRKLTLNIVKTNILDFICLKIISTCVLTLCI